MNIVEGLNKVYCFFNSSTYDGKTVTITDGTMTWADVLDSTSHDCTFMIPSMPAPAKKRYTVTLHNGDETAAAVYTRTFDLGFGDSLRIGLYTGDEGAKQSSITSLTSSVSTLSGNVSTLSTNLSNKITYGYSDKTAGSSSLAAGTIYCYIGS